MLLLIVESGSRILQWRVYKLSSSQLFFPSRCLALYWPACLLGFITALPPKWIGAFFSCFSHWLSPSYNLWCLFVSVCSQAPQSSQSILVFHLQFTSNALHTVFLNSKFYLRLHSQSNYLPAWFQAFRSGVCVFVGRMPLR